jgi:hypothetical protein
MTRGSNFSGAPRVLAGVRRSMLALALSVVACSGSQAGSQALAPAPPSPAAPPVPTPLPSGVVDPQPLVEQVKRMTAIVVRLDDITTKLVAGDDYMRPGNIPGPSVSVPTNVWVVAVVGDIRPNFGVMARPNSQCALFAFRADTSEIWSSSEGSLALCQPYFARSLTPVDAPVRCTDDSYDSGVPRDYTFSRTRPGPFVITPVRDDAWRQPTIVRGPFLAQAPEGSISYKQAFCVNAFIRQPAVEKLLLSGVGATLPQGLPPLEWAIWLRGYHAVSGSADDTGHIDVVVEPRAGYEWAFFDWHALVPDGGYVMFRFVDAAGKEVIPWRLANGP